MCLRGGDGRSCRRPSVLSVSAQERLPANTTPAVAAEPPGAGASVAAVSQAQATEKAAAEQPEPPHVSGQAQTADVAPGHQPIVPRPSDTTTPGGAGEVRAAEASSLHAVGDAANGAVRPKATVTLESTISNRPAARNDENSSAAAGNMMVRLTAADAAIAAMPYPHALQPGEPRATSPGSVTE